MMLTSREKRLVGLSIILFLFILPAGYLHAQSNVAIRQELRHISRAAHSTGITTISATKYIGSPYFLKWKQGYVIMTGNKRSKPMMLRYNIWKNNVQYIKNKKIYIIPAKELKGFVIKTKKGNLIFRNGFKTDEDHINQNSLLQVIYNGNVKLLAHHSSNLIKNIATYGTSVTKNKFLSHTDYYLQTPDGAFHKVKLKKKDILGALAGHKKKIKDYAKKHHLSFKNKSDLKKSCHIMIGLAQIPAVNNVPSICRF